MTSALIPLLQIHGMSIWRGDNLLLDNLNLSVKPGTALQIQGTNGTGKTTLLRAMIGLAEYDEGEVMWKGLPVAKERDNMHASLIYIGHKAGISPHLTPLENLRVLCPELASVHGDIFTSVLDELAMADRLHLPCSALSAGQRRRVVLSRLRLQFAELWVLDEPLTSLDTDGCEWVKQEMRRHVLHGGTVIFTTHQALEIPDITIEKCQLGNLM